MVSCYFNKLEVYPYLNINHLNLNTVLIYFYAISLIFSRSPTTENEKQQYNKTNIVGDLLWSHPVNEFEIHHNQGSKNGKLWYVYYDKWFITKH